MEGGITGKGFKKNDPRINRKGRPKSFDALRQLAQSIAHEQAKGNGAPVVIDGHIATNAEMIVRTLMRDNPERFLEIAFGKVPDKVEVSGAPVIIEFDYEKMVSGIAGRPTDDNLASGAD